MKFRENKTLAKISEFTAILTLYLVETPFNAFANRADPDQAALARAVWLGSTLFANGSMIDLIINLVDLISVQCFNFVLNTQS